MPTIGGVTILWQEGKPDGDDSLGIGDEDARSTKTAIRNAMAAEHVWDAAGGANTGAHVFGSARPYYGVQSNVSSTGSDGRIMQTSDTSRLFGVGSGGTSFLGGPTVISAGSFPGFTVPQRSIWVEEWGEGKTNSGSTVVTFPNSGFSGKPFVQVTGIDTNSRIQIVTIASVTATQLTVKSSATDLLGGSTTSFFWRSVGTRTL